MSGFLPSVEEERWMAVAAITGKNDFVRARCGAWRSFSLLPRIAFFILAAICVFALWGVLAVMSDSPYGSAVFAGIIAVIAAEVMIDQVHFFRAGIEEALMLAGIAFITSPAVKWSSTTTVFAIWGAVMLMIAGARLLNGFFIAGGVICIAIALRQSIGDLAVEVLCAIVGVAAILALTREWKRPSVNAIFETLAITMPLTAYLFAKSRSMAFDPMVVALLVVYAAIAIFFGLRYRVHAPLIAIFVTAGALGFELRTVTGLRLETRLIVWGSVTLAISVALERWLRTPRNGITSAKLRDDDKAFELLQLAGAAAITPAERPAAPSGLQTGGGGFGGAGASGDF